MSSEIDGYSTSDPLLHIHFNKNYMGVLVVSAIFIAVLLCCTIVGILFIPLLPFCLLTYYIVYKRRVCYVTRSYIYMKQEAPVIPFLPFLTNTTEKTIPLQKITDLTISENFIQKWFRFSTLKVETAGNTQAQAQSGQSDLEIVGIPADAVRNIKQQILELVSSRTLNNEYSLIDQPSMESTTSLLKDIRDSLQRLESRNFNQV